MGSSSSRTLGCMDRIVASDTQLLFPSGKAVGQTTLEPAQAQFLQGRMLFNPALIAKPMSVSRSPIMKLRARGRYPDHGELVYTYRYRVYGLHGECCRAPRCPRYGRVRKIEPIHSDALFCDQIPHFLVHCLQLFHAQVSPGNAALIGHDDDLVVQGCQDAQGFPGLRV